MQHLLRQFEVENLIADQCPIKPHKHSFFELVYILEGDGCCIVDDYRHPYGKDDLFVIVPEKGHHTIVQSTTSFVFIRFNTKFLRIIEDQTPRDTEKAWLEKIEYIFINQQKLAEAFDSHTKAFVRSLCVSIVEESTRNRVVDLQLLYQMIETLLMVIVKRIESQAVPAILPYKSSIREIVDYIHENIRIPAKLRIDRIAEHVNMSGNYVGEYFRKFHTKSLHRYITDYKFGLIEERLRRSDLRISEIAYEFGFSGESHLTTAFRKRNGVSPTRFRKTTSENHS